MRFEPASMQLLLRLSSVFIEGIFYELTRLTMSIESLITVLETIVPASILTTLIIIQDNKYVFWRYTVERTSERQLTGSTLTTDEKMIDFFRPRRRLLFRRLWRSRCCLVGGKNKMTDCDEWQQKALIRHLTRILSTSQLDTLARVVEQRTYYYVHIIISCRLYRSLNRFHNEK